MTEENINEERTVEETMENTPEVYHPRDSKYDIIGKISPFLDLHLLFPVFSWLESTGMYIQKDLDMAKLELLKPTKMVDFAIEIYKSVNNTEEVPQEMLDKREEVLAQFKVIQENDFVSFLSNETETVDQLINDNLFTRQALQEHEISSSAIDESLSIAKFQMDCGAYQEASELLFYYITLLTPTLPRPISMPNDPLVVALWGKFAADLLHSSSQDAFLGMKRIMDIISTDKSSSPSELLQQRAYLLHWSLFLAAQHPAGIDIFNNIIFNMTKPTEYLSTIELCCPWLMRYVCASVINNQKAWKSHIVDLLKRISTVYSDPLTELLVDLLINLNFDNIKEHMKEMEIFLYSDFFFSYLGDEFIQKIMSNIRLLILDVYCPLFRTSSIDHLTSILHIKEDELESWLSTASVNYKRFFYEIQEDSNEVIIRGTNEPIYEQILKKSKGISERAKQQLLLLESRSNTTN
ncbi:hypothetical protein WA158_002245 [Blastocystis sp. Blastoise]